MIYFEDSVTAHNLPTDQAFGVYYVDGDTANEAEVRARLPHAKLFGITVFGKTGKDIFAVDCEKGDVTPAGAEKWVEAQLALGANPICVYADLSTWDNGLKVALEKYGAKIKRWVADYNNRPLIPAGFDAIQYENTPLVDKDLALPTFFSPYVEPHPTGVASALVHVDFDNGTWDIRHLPGTAHYAGPRKEWSAEIQIEAGANGGQWRIKGLPADSKPLGN